MIDRMQDYKQRHQKAETPRDDVNTPDGDASDALDKISDDDPMKNSMPAGDEFLIWEPRGYYQKMKNMVENMIETYMFFIIGIVAYSHPSISAIVYLLMSAILFLPMTKDIKERYKWNMIYLIIVFVYMLIASIYKLVKQKKMFEEGKSYSKEDYPEVVDFLLKLGFSFKYDPTIFDLQQKSQA